MRRRWVGMLLVTAMLGLSLWAYPQLPERMPTHWNVRGEVDGWSGRWAVFMQPAMALVLMVLLPLLRKIDPRRENYARFEPTFWLLINLVVGFLLIVHVMMIGSALGWPLPPTDVVVMMAVGVLLIMLGNYLPRVRSNWWMGIRTPWTLSSERVWRSTHRLGGRTFVLGGLILLASPLLPASVRGYAIITAVTVSALIPAVWSYIDWRREAREAREA